MAPEVGLEPTTDRLTADCSTIELLWNPDEVENLRIWSPFVNSFWGSERDFFCTLRCRRAFADIRGLTGRAADRALGFSLPLPTEPLRSTREGIVR